MELLRSPIPKNPPNPKNPEGLDPSGNGAGLGMTTGTHPMSPGRASDSCDIPKATSCHAMELLHGRIPKNPPNPKNPEGLDPSGNGAELGMTTGTHPMSQDEDGDSCDIPKATNNLQPHHGPATSFSHSQESTKSQESRGLGSIQKAHTAGRNTSHVPRQGR
ncbi:hypothetical protein DUI87_00156 [Hirundo rustica rustica]|uniref:Uncharacterized protein n=1 Tax=Hirundo rustica rustica TaxID=333673 RepID=A0A3M0LJ11_HIRRU|nr:hypothetical protein DUI87_00156 [Hirundo rustica rustica]